MRTIILAVDREKRRISFGLKPSYFVDGDFLDDHVDEVSADAVTSSSNGLIDQHDPVRNDYRLSIARQGINGTAESQDETLSEEGETVIENSAGSEIAATAYREDLLPRFSTLKLARGFRWDPSDPSHDDEGTSTSSEDISDNEGQKRRTKRTKKAIEQDMTADMQSRTPQSNSDFERLLLGSPSSSYLWIQYISFQLQLTEIEKARQIGARAIQTISFREEQERQNVWIALLNLENVYGTEETMDKVFREAVRHCDAKTIHLRLASIYEQSGKYEVRRTELCIEPMCLNIASTESGVAI